MKLCNYIAAASISACNIGFNDTGEAMPIEVVACSHPDSRYEGVVHIEVEDEIVWDNVYFEISQGDNRWKTRLQTENQLLWWTRMQLYELDCHSEFNYEINYGGL